MVPSILYDADKVEPGIKKSNEHNENAIYFRSTLNEPACSNAGTFSFLTRMTPTLGVPDHPLEFPSLRVTRTLACPVTNTRSLE